MAKKKVKAEEVGIDLPHINATVYLKFEKKSEVDWIEGSEAFTSIYNTGEDPEIHFNIEEDLSVVTVVHEVTHAVTNILQMRGFKTVGEWDDEVLPYHLGYVIGQVLKVIQKKGIKLTD